MSQAVDPAYLALANKLADAAAAVIRPYFRKNVAVDDKADQSPVTIADREAEAVMRRLIGETFPDHGIFGEEHGQERTDAEYVWVLDPIDGTKSFISGMPVFGTLIALAHRGRPILGIIDQPISGERWVGAQGHPSTLNGTRITTRACGDLAQATLFSTSPDLFPGEKLTAFDRLRTSVKLTRYGADCYAYGLLSAGFIDLVVEDSLKPYDYCALAAIIEGAGGVATDWDGRPLGLDSPGHVVACGDPRLIGPARDRLRGA